MNRNEHIPHDLEPSDPDGYERHQAAIEAICAPHRPKGVVPKQYDSYFDQ